jgi:hypothetical protein
MVTLATAPYQAFISAADAPRADGVAGNATTTDLYRVAPVQTRTKETVVIDHEPTVRDRYVGQELLRAAQKCGRNSGEMAELLGWSPSKVSRLLSGQRVTSTEDVSAYLALCGVVGAHRAELLALAARRYEQLWWQDHGTRAPVRNTVLVDNEDRAVAITSFGDTLVPALLQVPAYTRALLATHPTIPDHEIEERVAETQRRQRILDREFSPPQLFVFVAEYALTRTGGGDAAMSEQARHLLELAEQAKISIRIVPDDGVRDIGPFTLLEFAAHQPAICLEHLTTTAFLQRPETIATYRTTIAGLDHAALDEASSRARIADMTKRRARGSRPTIASPVNDDGRPAVECALPAEPVPIWAG